MLHALNRRISESRNARTDDGMTLLDVLIGIAIFALIAIIAVSALGQYRLRAFEAAAMSDARQVGIALEGEYIDRQAYPEALSRDASELPEVNMTLNNEVGGYNADGDVAAFCVVHAKGPWATYATGSGGIIDHGRRDAPGECTGAGLGMGDGMGGTTEVPAPSAPPIANWTITTSWTNPLLSEGQFSVGAYCLYTGPCDAERIRGLLPPGVTIVGPGPENDPGWIIETDMPVEDLVASLNGGEAACRFNVVDYDYRPTGGGC